MRRHTRALTAILSALFTAVLFSGDVIHAQGPRATLVKDINTGPLSGAHRQLIAFGNGVLYSNDDVANGDELWFSDGTLAGTRLVKDIALARAGSGITFMTDLNGTVFFSATNGLNGFELWKTDGTTAGTVMVKDIVPGANGSNPENITKVGSLLFFSASDGSSGTELYRSDGTSGGTFRVRDIMSGPGSSSPANLVDVNGTAFFTATDGTNGVELWKSNGTLNNAVMVAAITPGNNSLGTGPVALKAFNGSVYFWDNDGTNGIELWTSDGTTTVMVRDINPGAGSSGGANQPISVLNATTIVFAANNGLQGLELWSSNGTVGNAALVKDIFPGPNSGGCANGIVLNGIYYCQANDGVVNTELWKSDATLAGTSLVLDIEPGVLPSLTTPTFAAFGGRVYFQARTSAHGTELWSSDGSPGGTAIVKEAIPGPASNGAPAWLTPSSNRLFFTASDSSGSELWSTDGTTPGTLPVRTTPRQNQSSNPEFLTNVNGRLVFSALVPPVGNELAQSDGTAAGTGVLADIQAGAGAALPSKLTVSNGVLFFSALQSATGYELWKSDGTPAGTTLVADIVSGSGGSFPDSLIDANGTLFFLATDFASTGTELYKSDGVITSLVKDIVPGTGSSSPQRLTNVNGRLFFVTTASPGSNAELWTSDGTASGTVMVKDIALGPSSSSPNVLTALGNTVLFIANDFVNGPALWKSDGTAVNTALVKDYNASTTLGANGPSSAVVNGVAYFSLDDGSHGLELWRSDGTPAGTFLAADICPGSCPSAPVVLTPFTGNTLAFIANDGVHGAELWTFDGTTATLVADINPVGNANITALTAANGRLYFVANDGTNGIELWASDGTAAGTVFYDVYPGVGSSTPGNVTAVGTTIFFTANGGPENNELWKLAKGDQAITVTQAAPSSTASGSTFTVAATSSSNLAVVITAGPPAVCAVVAGGSGSAAVQMNATSGTCTTAFDQPGDAAHNPAPQVTNTTTAINGGQTITFGPLPDVSYGAADFTVTATASSGLPVSFSTLTPGQCSVTGATVHVITAGGCTIRATQNGDATYAPAPHVDQPFTIVRAPLILTAANASKDFDGNPFTGFTAALSGFVYGDTEVETRALGTLTGAAGFTGAATTATNAGSFPITPTVGTLAATNYDVTMFVDGTLGISPAGTTTMVTCPASVGFTGSALTPCSVAVSGAGGLSLAPTPTYANNIDAGTASASYTYAGDTNHTSSSDSETFSITPADTAVTNVTAIASTVGGTTTLAAQITPAGVPGSVAFFVNGSATAVTASYTAGTGVASVAGYVHGLGADGSGYSVRAVFTPTSSNYLGSEATNPRALIVTTAPTTTGLVTSGSPSTFGNAVTFTATVSGSVVTEGTVLFYDGGTSCAAPGPALGAPQSVTGGLASIATSALSAGSHTILACFSGSVSFAPSSASVTQVVAPRSTATVVSNASVAYNVGVAQHVTLTASVVPQPAPVGSVTFTVTGVAGGVVGATSFAAGIYSADFTVPAGTAVGAYTISAQFTGIPNYAASPVAASTLTVTPVSGLLGQIAAVDPDLSPIDGFDVLFGKGGSATLLKIKNTNPGTFHYQLTLTNRTGVELHEPNVSIDNQNGGTVVTFLQLPSLPTNVNTPIPSGALSPYNFTLPANSAFNVQGNHAVQVHPDDRTDELPVTIKWLGSLPASYTQCSDVPDPATGSPWIAGQPWNAAILKCVKIEGMAIPRDHTARIRLQLEFALKGTDLWAANAQTMFRAGFAFKSTEVITLDRRFPIASLAGQIYTGTQQAVVIGAGKQVTAIGGFVVDENGNGLDRIVKIYASPQTDCAVPGAITTASTMADGFYFAEVPDGTKWWIAVCDPNAAGYPSTAPDTSRLLDHKLMKKEFDEEDFYLDVP